MAPLPSNIPSSFVPHEPTVVRGRLHRFGLDSLFSLVSYGLLAIIFIISIGLFIYGRLLSSNLAAKDASLTNIEKSIDQNSVREFARLQDRLTASQTLLNHHLALSGFFTALQSLVPATVRFTDLHVTVDNSGAAQVTGVGTAKSFNALAAASASFAADGRIKDAIFSKMTVLRDTSVSFSFSATLDPKLIAYAPSVPTATTATTTAP